MQEAAPSEGPQMPGPGPPSPVLHVHLAGVALLLAALSLYSPLPSRVNCYPFGIPKGLGADALPWSCNHLFILACSS